MNSSERMKLKLFDFDAIEKVLADVEENSRNIFEVEKLKSRLEVV
jgi:hypothetical protein